MLLGTGSSVLLAAPARNEAQSARVFTVSPQDLLAAEELAARLAIEIVGVFHSHTHSEPYPSPTDVRLAPDPSWIYCVVSLKRPLLEMRMFHIDQAGIMEVPAELIDDDANTTRSP